MKRRILSLLLVLTLLMALPFAGSAEAAAKKSVTVAMLSDPALTYTETVKFSVKDEDGQPVTDGTVNLRSSVEGSSQCSCPVNNGVAEIQASTLVSNLGLPLGQPIEIFSCYLPGSGAYEATAETPLTITVKGGTLPTVALTSAGYAYGNPVSDFQLTTPTGVQIGEKQIRDANDAEVTDGTFGAQAYTLWVKLKCEEGYKLSEEPAVTLDGKKPLRVEGGFYVFELEELYPTYTITYKLDGGTIFGQPTSYNKYSGTVTIPNPTKDGYRFLGWTGEDITEPQKDISFAAKEMNQNLTYTAKWEEIIYHNVGFVTGHGATPQPQQVESGTKAARPADPTEDGWKFKGWYISDDYIGEPFDFTTAITENTTLHAKWAKTWTVTFDSNGHGTAPAMQTVEEGENAVKPADPTAEGYSFQGWYTTAECTEEFQFDTTPITGNTTVYAKWVKKPIVSFNTNGHGAAPASQTVELNGKAVKPADPTAEGYVFRGWYTTAACTTEFDFNTPIAADTTLYAKWDEIYTVTFNVGGHGTAPAAQKVENGGKATKPENPTAKGWRFDGWYTDEKCTARYDFDKAVTANTTLYAKWTQLFTLTFETNGGTKIDSVEAPDGSLVYLGSYKPTKSGYYFVGWYTDKNLTRASRVGYVRMDGNKTVYAKFAVADKTNPKTADPALPGLALAVLSFSTVGLAAMGLKKRK